MSYFVYVVSCLYVSFSGFIISVGEERANFLLSITRNYEFSVRRGFVFLLWLII